MAITSLGNFSVAEDTKFAKCKNCTELVTRGGDNTKSFNTTNLVHHLKTKQLLEMKHNTCTP